MVLHLAFGRIHGFIYFASVIASYLLGVITYRVLDVVMAEHSSTKMLAPLVFVLFLLTDVVGILTDYGEIRYICILTRDEWSTTEVLNGWTKNGPMLFMSAAFGIVNTMSLSSTKYVTLALTGHLQRIGQSMGSNTFIILAKLSGDRRAAFDHSYLVPLLLVCSFLTGSILTGLSFKYSQPARQSGVAEEKIGQVAEVVNADREYLLPLDFFFTVLGFLISVLIILHDTAYANRVARKLRARKELQTNLMAEQERDLGESTLKRAPARAFWVRQAKETVAMEKVWQRTGMAGLNVEAESDSGSRAPISMVLD